MASPTRKVTDGVASKEIGILNKGCSEGMVLTADDVHGDGINVRRKGGKPLVNGGLDGAVKVGIIKDFVHTCYTIYSMSSAKIQKNLFKQCLDND